MNINSLLALWQDKIPADGVYMLRESLEKIDESKLSNLYMVQLKNPIVGLVLGIFIGVFGADRFYKGDIGIGVAKLLICWITFGIWWLVDLFLVWQGIKKDNLNRINQAIMYSK